MIKKILSSIVSIVFSIVFFILFLILDQKLQLSIYEKLTYGGSLFLAIFLSLKHVKNKSSTLYIKVYKNRLVIRDLKNKVETERHINGQYMSATELVSEKYTEVGAILKEGIKKYFIQKWYLLRPEILIHAMGTQVDELTAEESELFKELAFDAGARRVSILTGPEPDDDFLLQVIKETK